MDESRKKFEEYVAKELRSPFETITEVRNGDRHFVSSSMDIHHSLNEWWVLWQVSRAAIEIIVPKLIDSKEALAKEFIVDYSNGFGDVMDACEENIRAAGVKVKE